MMFLLWCTLAEAGRPLTYDEALAAAATNNPELATARLALQQAEGSVLSARGGFDPTYNLSGGWRQSRTQGFFQGFPFTSRSEAWDITHSLQGTAATGTTYALNAALDRNFSSFVTDFGFGESAEQIQDAYTSDLNVSVTQQLLEGVRTRYNLQNVTRATTQLSTAELSLRRAEQGALFTAAEAYWQWVYTANLEAIALESVAVAEEALRVGRAQVEGGTLAPVEGTRLEAALVQAQQAALDAHNNTELAANTLLVAIGESPDQDVSPATPAGDVPAQVIEADAAIAVALAQNLDLAVARANVELARFDVANAKHAMLPSLSATGAAGVRAQDTSPGAALSGITDADNQPFMSISGNLSVPLGNRAARGSRDSQQGLLAQRERELADLERSVAAQTEQQVRALQSAQRRTELADANLRLAEQTLSAEEALSQAGRNLQRDVLTARNELDRAKAEAAKARTDYRLALAQLQRLQGQLQ